MSMRSKHLNDVVDPTTVDVVGGGDEDKAPGLKPQGAVVFLFRPP